MFVVFGFKFIILLCGDGVLAVSEAMNSQSVYPEMGPSATRNQKSYSSPARGRNSIESRVRVRGAGSFPHTTSLLQDASKFGALPPSRTTETIPF